jgi:hypothetical protein
VTSTFLGEAVDRAGDGRRRRDGGRGTLAARRSATASKKEG